MKTLSSIVAIVAVFYTGVASATAIGGDFRTSGDLPDQQHTQGPLVYERLGAAIDGGVELTGADLLSNPTPWIPGLVHIDYDPLTNILLLDSQDRLDFQIFDVSISNMVFDTPQMITGLTLLSDDLTVPYRSDFSPVTPTFSFTGDSIHLQWDAGHEAFDFTGGTAVFQVELSPSTAPIPEPATLSLLGMGLVGLVTQVRRRK